MKTLIYYVVEALSQRMEPGEEIRLPRRGEDQLGDDDHQVFMGSNMDFHYTPDEVVVRRTMEYKNG